MRVGLFLILILFGCAKPEPPPNEAPGKPVFEPEQLSFGDVPVNGSRALGLALRNEGKAVLNLNASVEGPFEVEPEVVGITAGASAEFVVRFKPVREAEESGWLRFRDDSGSTHEIPLSGRGVEMALLVEPETIDFGEVDAGKVKRRSFKVKNIASGTLEIRLMLSGSEAFSVDTLPFSLQAGEERELEVEFAPTRFGDHSAHLEISPCEDCLPVGVELGGQGAAARFNTAPDTLDFGTVPLSLRAEKNFILFNSGSRPGTLESVEVGGGNFSVQPQQTLPAEVQPGDFLEFAVEFHSTRKGSFSETLQIETGAGQVALNLRARAGGPFLAADSLEFGLVPLEEAVRRRVVIRNEGDSGIVLLRGAETSGAGGAFRVVSDIEETSIGWEVEVEFSSADPGPHSGLLRVSTALPYQPLLEIPLSGEVVPPGCKLRFDPQPLYFGMVDGEKPSRFSFEIRQEGEDPCLIWNPRFGNSSVQLASGGFDGFKVLTQGESWRMVATREPGGVKGSHSIMSHFSISAGRKGMSVGSNLTFVEVVPFPFDPEETQIHDAPVGRTTLSVIDLGPRPDLQQRYEIEDSDFLLAPHDLDLVGPGLPILFRPRSVGEKKTRVYAYLEDYPEPYIFEVKAEGLAPCSGCDWPEVSCSWSAAGDSSIIASAEVAPPGLSCAWILRQPGLPDSQVSNQCGDLHTSIPSGGLVDLLFLAFDEERAALCEISITP